MFRALVCVLLLSPNSAADVITVPGDVASVQGAVDRALPGDIVDLDGTVMGRHDGVVNYTIGQRRGLGIGGRSGDTDPLYVIRIDPDRNQVRSSLTLPLPLRTRRVPPTPVHQGLPLGVSVLPELPAAANSVMPSPETC